MVGRRLLWFAVVFAVGHHVGVGLEFLGDVGASGTRWADWVDLAVPYAVVLAGAGVLSAARADRIDWGLLLLGAVVYTQGHGIHLAANSVGNADPGDVAHLWDEQVSHWIWYLGLTVLVVALVRAAPAMPLRPVSTPAVVLAGFTWFDNTVEGAVPALGFAAAVLVGGYAWRQRVRPIAAAYALAFLLLAVWGVWHRGFPEFTELGWV
jgi:hypothetical protein